MLKPIIIPFIVLALFCAASTAPAQAQIMLLINGALGKEPYKQTPADKKTTKFFEEQERWGR